MWEGSQSVSVVHCLYSFTFYWMTTRLLHPASFPSRPVGSCPINTVSGAARLLAVEVPSFERPQSCCRCSLSLSWRSRMLLPSQMFHPLPSAEPWPGPGSCTASGSSSLEPSQSAGSYLRVSWSWSCWRWSWSSSLRRSWRSHRSHFLRRVTVAEQLRPGALRGWQDQTLEDSGPVAKITGSYLKIYLKIYSS